MGKPFDIWYVIGASEYPCRLNIVLLSPCVSIRVFISDASLLQSSIRMICSAWRIHFKISLLISIKNRVLGSFWIFMIMRASSCWLYSPTTLVLTVVKYAVMIFVLILLFHCSNIHYQLPRLLNSWPVAITIHDNSSTAMIAVPPLWNITLGVNRLYPLRILLILNHPSVLLYILSVMVILLQLLFTSESPMIASLSIYHGIFKGI